MLALLQSQLVKEVTVRTEDAVAWTNTGMPLDITDVWRIKTIFPIAEDIDVTQ